jgi:hypothetical protein
MRAATRCGCGVDTAVSAPCRAGVPGLYGAVNTRLCRRCGHVCLHKPRQRSDHCCVGPCAAEGGPDGLVNNRAACATVQTRSRSTGCALLLGSVVPRRRRFSESTHVASLRRLLSMGRLQLSALGKSTFRGFKGGRKEQACRHRRRGTLTCAVTMLGQRTPNTYASAAPQRNYVSGVGRGAVGFTTRSDIGPARPGVGAEMAPGGMRPAAAPSGYVAGAGRGATGMGDSGSAALMGAVPGAGILGGCPHEHVRVCWAVAGWVEGCRGGWGFRRGARRGEACLCCWAL